MARGWRTHKVRFLLTNLCAGPHYCLVKRGVAVVTWLIPLFALVFAAGCASSSLHSEAVADIERRLVEFRRAQADSKARLEEVNNKLLLLQERVEDDRRVVDDLRQMAFPETPPQELKVVKLSEEEGEQGQKREEKKAKKREAEKRDGKSERPQPAGPAGYEPEDIYRRAQDLFWSWKLNDAVDVFKLFTVEYPRHHLADNALYWTGEAYYSQKKYREALDEFLGLIEQYPKGNKAPDALLKVAYSYIELDRSSEAEEALMRVIKTYPGSESAIKAKQTIKELYTNRRGEQ